MNPYSVLGILPGANENDIKAAFRKKIKELHPDTRPRNAYKKNSIEAHHIIEAYELLCNAEKRREFEISFRSAEVVSSFNYRNWLQERADILSKAKLIFYDVLRERGKEAMLLYNQIFQEYPLQLEKLLGKEDYMDCAFMLALECENQGNYGQAVKFYLRLCQLEHQKSYFRHFFVEVETRLLPLLTMKITWEIPLKTFAHIIQEMQGYAFSPRSKAMLLLKQAQLYDQLGQTILAMVSLHQAKRFLPRDKKIASFEKDLSGFSQGYVSL